MDTSERIQRGLDSLNFFLADVRDGLGPYLAIYLLTVQHWDEQRIGLVMTVMGIATVLCQVPAGALIDAIRRKRELIALAAACVALACLIMPLLPRFWLVAGAQTVIGMAAAVFAPAIAAITLGTIGHASLAARLGRNEAFNHLGNTAAALAAGLAGWLFSPVAVFYLVAAFALISIACCWMIPSQAIDHQRARGLSEAADTNQPSGWRVLLGCRPLLLFAVCVMLFHLANAAMLPLVGQKLALQNKANATLYMSACIIGAQLVMVGMAMLVGRRADAWGRKPLFLAGFAILPLRGVLYTLSDNSYWLLGVQLLDGVGAGIYGALFPLIIADLTRGTGRYNVSQGALATAQGLGAARSTTVAGFIIVHAGYSAAFHRACRLQRRLSEPGGHRRRRACAVLAWHTGDTAGTGRHRTGAGLGSRPAGLNSGMGMSQPRAVDLQGLAYRGQAQPLPMAGIVVDPHE